MTVQAGRDLLIKIGDGGEPETFSTIGAARLVSLEIGNTPADVTSLGDAGISTYVADAGTQEMTLGLQGLFCDSSGEEMMRAAAFGRHSPQFRLCFPNGDVYEAAFVVTRYARSGTHDGLEGFSVTLTRSGSGIFTAAE